MPLFCFPKEWFDPHLPFAQSFLEVFGLMIGLSSVEKLLKEGAMDTATDFAGSAFCSNRTSGANLGIGSIADQLLAYKTCLALEWLTLRTDECIFLGIIVKMLNWIKGCALAEVGCGQPL